MYSRMTEEDIKIWLNVANRAFTIPLVNWVIEKKKQHNIPEERCRRYVVEVSELLAQCASRAADKDAAIMICRQVLLLSPEKVKELFEKLNCETTEILAICDELSDLTDFPNIGSARKVKIKLEFEK